MTRRVERLAAITRLVGVDHRTVQTTIQQWRPLSKFGGFNLCAKVFMNLPQALYVLVIPIISGQIDFEFWLSRHSARLGGLECRRTGRLLFCLHGSRVDH